MKKAVLVFLVGSFATSLTFGQSTNGWHLKDKQKSGYYGISLDQAYAFLKSKKQKSTRIIVAVIDSGIDTLHEDLKPILWTNTKEIPNNGIDDDNNGYIDDIHGWNYLGGKDGKSVKEDSYEAARVYHSLKSKYANKDEAAIMKSADKEEYLTWKRAKESVIGGEDNGVDVAVMRKALESMQKTNEILKTGLKKEVFTGEELDAFTPASEEEKKAKAAMLGLMKANSLMDKSNKEFMEGFEEFVNAEEKKDAAKTNPPTNYRLDVTGDDESNWNSRGYGNNDVMSLTPMHGTHVSGIIAAARNNGKGIDGVADNVSIMALRAVPDGDEHDKDIALAIRYAVDNGAKVINMSFGKNFSPYKQWIDEAVQYAQKKGVLLVHAAGNDNSDIDAKTTYNFPCAEYLSNGKQASNWITVGASGDPKIGGMAANFSNYGKKKVDVFAPGVSIYATLPGGNTYGNLQGTSMASPVVAGVAALIKSYFPNLTPEQIKTAIEKSTVKPQIKTKKPGTEDMVNLSDISKTGGVINAYGAVKAAYDMSKGTPTPTPAPKSKVTKPIKG
jgi:subtilisin family serine protease